MGTGELRQGGIRADTCWSRGCSCETLPEPNSPWSGIFSCHNGELSLCLSPPPFNSILASGCDSVHEINGVGHCEVLKSLVLKTFICLPTNYGRSQINFSFNDPEDRFCLVSGGYRDKKKPSYLMANPGKHPLPFFNTPKVVLLLAKFAFIYFNYYVWSLCLSCWFKECLVLLLNCFKSMCLYFS